MKRTILLACLFLALISSATAQPRAQLRMIGAAIGDSIVVRWAVANTDAWRVANLAGYILERTVLDGSNKVVGQSSKRVTKDTIRPWTYASLEGRLKRTDTLALVAAQSLYGKSMRTISPNEDLIGALQQSDDEADNRHGFALIAADLSPLAANLLGWRWVDRDVKPTYKYIYTLRCASIKGQIVSDTAYFIVKPNDFIALQPLSPPTVIQDEKTVSLRWKKETHISAYHIERSEDGVHFKRLNQQPYMEWQQPGINQKDSIAYVDSLGINYKPFYYRLIGINPFAQLTPASTMVVGMGVDRTPPPSPLSLQVRNPKKATVELNWTNPISEEPLKGLIVARAYDIAGPYGRLHENLLPAQTTQFTDEKAFQFGTNYYTVGLVDTAGNIGWSPQVYVVMEDFEPPVQPVGLQGSIDTAGLVKLKWNIGPDYDLKGYNVYIANQTDHTFIPVADTLLTDTVFQYRIDLRNLTEHVFFRIKAFDQHLRESAFSEILDLKKPDLIPPSAPVFDDYKVSERSVYLHWRPSNSKDAVGQYLLRRSVGGNWKTLVQLPMPVASYTDTVLASGESWEYAIQAIDDDGLVSPNSFPVGVKIPAYTKKKNFAALVANWDKEKRGIQLQWTLNSSCDRILVYRAYGEDGLELCARLEGTDKAYFDAPKRKGKYSFALKPLFANGSEGLLSETVTITIN
jgi:fibronectin type 3 domain-containing protein